MENSHYLGRYRFLVRSKPAHFTVRRGPLRAIGASPACPFFRSTSLQIEVNRRGLVCLLYTSRCV